MKEHEAYRFKCEGEELAKVLYYYGLIYDTSQSEYKIVCPFHEDVNPSMICNLEDGSYYCFGCGESGDAFSFVRKMNEGKLNDLQSCKEYFKILKSKSTNSIDFSKRIKKAKKADRQLYDEAYDYYHGLSKVDWFNDTSEEVIETRKYMKQRGFTRKTLNNFGAKVTFNNSYPIIFPMIDNGKFKGWVCRTDKPTIEKKRKYLYNSGFSRATTLVGEYRNYETVFIVEGYMDRLKFVQFGINNVVAILGWKMSNEQIKKLKEQGIEHVISALDNDECGKKGTEFLKRHFIVTRFVYKKTVKDVGEMNKATFDECLKRTKKKYFIDKKNKKNRE